MDLNFQMHCLSKELTNYSLLRHRDFAGHLVTGKNSGTHWVKYIICLALAEHYGVAPPAYFNAEATNDFMGHPKKVRPQPGLPRLASSHGIPGFGYEWGLLRGADPMPPVALLVRDLRHVLISHYEKWKDTYEVDWATYLRGRMGKRGFRCDIWWYIRFLNRWGDALYARPSEVLVVRYENLRNRPAEIVAQVLAHFELQIPKETIARAVAASSKDAMADKADPDFPERIVDAREDRLEDYFSGEDGTFFENTIERNLKHRFGYDYAI